VVQIFGDEKFSVSARSSIFNRNCRDSLSGKMLNLRKDLIPRLKIGTISESELLRNLAHSPQRVGVFSLVAS
jgi:hypothetical protein